MSMSIIIMIIIIGSVMKIVINVSIKFILNHYIITIHCKLFSLFSVFSLFFVLPIGNLT